MENLRLTDNFVIRRVMDQVMLVPMVRDVKEDPYIYNLNPTAGEILDHLKAGLTRDQILTTMAGEYEGTSKEQLATDVDECLKGLAEIGLLENGT